jgi:ubiquinone/menaquinone biosynthesis C-methylase UbiE
MSEVEPANQRSGGIGQLFDAYRTLRYLDAVRRLPDVGRIKAQMMELLELRPGQHALDVGCGTGEDVWSLAERVGQTGSAKGVDANPWMIGEANRRAGEAADDLPVSFQVGDAYNLPCQGASFDAVRAERLFVHLVEPERALEEMIRVTRPGGIVLVADASFETLRLAGPRRRLTEPVIRSTIERFPSPGVGGQLGAMFRVAGLEAVKAIVVDHVARTVEEAETLFTIARTTAELVEAGAVTEDEEAEWRASLTRLEQRGELAWNMRGYIVRGRVPT